MPIPNIIITDLGRAALVNADNTGTLPVTIAQIGYSQAALAPLPTATALPGEFKRIAGVSGTVVANDTIHVTALDESADTYELRSFALYLADGTLFAIYGQPDPILEKAAASFTLLGIDVIFADISAASLTFGNTEIIMPPSTTERLGVVELATFAEAAAGVDAQRALTPATAKAAILGWLLSLDGAGSGLDADLLDGQHGSWYADIVARLGYTPLNVLAYTAADVLTKLLSVDGAGSGVDADLLDGQQGSWYSNIPARLGFTPLDAAMFVGAQILSRLLTVDGAGSGLDADLLRGFHWHSGQNVTFGMVDATTPNAATTGGIRLRTNPVTGSAFEQITNHNATAQYGYWAYGAPGQADWYGAAGLRSGGNPVMHHGNDGAGSGFDADMVDGWHAASFAKYLDFLGGNQNLSVPGYQVFPGGLKIMWGAGNIGSNASLAVTFPFSFQQSCLFLASGGNGNAGIEGSAVNTGQSLSQGFVTNSGTAGYFTWIAWGF